MQAGNSTRWGGQEIRETRERFGITAKQLASEAGISRDTLAAIETGMVRGRPYRRKPNRSTLDAVHRGLHCLVDSIARKRA